jgi:hypothetical protein
MACEALDPLIREETVERQQPHEMLPGQMGCPVL